MTTKTRPRQIMLMRINEFSFEVPVTFYGVGYGGFINFNGTNLADLKQIAAELSNGDRAEYPPDEVKMYEITIREIPTH